MERSCSMARMKKATSVKSSTAVEGSGKPKTVEEYLAAVPEPARSTLEKVRAVIRTTVPPEATEVISYGIPTFKGKGLMIAYAAFTNHCSLFVLSGSLLDSFKDELKGYETSKGTIRFPVDKPLPAALVKKLVKARLAHNESRKKR
jgi:uncharacterized protein YdhG (YjbR/CyaY superfamily)